MRDDSEDKDREADPNATRIVASVVAAAVAVALLLLPGRALDLLRHDSLTDQAEYLLDDALDRNMVTFVSVSGVKAVIAMVEGSSVGVGFDLELGDLVQPAYDYIDFIWKIFLFALVILSFYQLLMKTGLLGTGFALMGAGMLIWAVSVYVPRRLVPLRRWGRFFVVLGLLVAYVVPISLVGTHYISAYYLDNVKAANARRIEEVKANFDSARTELLDVREKISLLNPGASFDELRATASESVWESMFAFLNYVIILMVELLLLPFFSAYILYKALSLVLRDPRRLEGTVPSQMSEKKA